MKSPEINLGDAGVQELPVYRIPLHKLKHDTGTTEALS